MRDIFTVATTLASRIVKTKNIAHITSFSIFLRDSIKTETANREETGMPFHNFQPHDDWIPTPPKLKAEKPNPKKEAEIDRFPLPHQRNSRLTPGEIQVIKDMRASPNIPEDAKPELPEGYE